MRTSTLVLLAGIVLVPQQRLPLVEGTKTLLRSARLTDRGVAVDAVAKTPPLQGDAEIRAEIIDQLDSLNVGRPLPGLRQVSEHDLGEYRLAVIRAVATFHDPRAVPVLIPNVDIDPLAVAGLGKFGDAAVEPLLKAYDLAVLRKDPALTKRGLLEALAAVQRTTGIRDAALRVRVLRLVNRELVGPEEWPILAGASRLAMAFGTPDLVQLVRDLAEGRLGMHLSQRDAERVRRTALRALQDGGH